ncbi:hypothetical protein [Xenorhabdus bovienii]|nr:hypothetical protein [Xenorhabdus bovienii]
MRRIPFQISGLLALNGVSILGNAITDIAIPWLILEISGSPILSGYMLVLCLISLNLLSGQYILFAQLFAIGCCIGFTAPVEVTLIQRQVPENLFSRIITLFSSTRFLAVPVGYVCFGTLLGSSLIKQTPLIMATIVLGGLLAYLAMHGRVK